MTGSITSLISNTFSPITGKSSGADKTNTSDHATTLADALNESKNADAFTLSLSDEALKQLQAARQKVSGATQQKTDNFTLKPYQQDALDAILDKYTDLPLTDENYADLQNELYDAGLSPEQLSMMDKVSTFNSTQALMDAMNGKEYDPGSFLDNVGAVDEAKTENYLNDIVSRWNDAYNAAHPEEPDTEIAAEAGTADASELDTSGEASA